MAASREWILADNFQTATVEHLCRLQYSLERGAPQTPSTDCNDGDVASGAWEWRWPAVRGPRPPLASSSASWRVRPVSVWMSRGLK